LLKYILLFFEKLRATFQGLVGHIQCSTTWSRCTTWSRQTRHMSEYHIQLIA